MLFVHLKIVEFQFTLESYLLLKTKYLNELKKLTKDEIVIIFKKLNVPKNSAETNCNLRALK